MQFIWLVANFDDTQTEQSDISWILHLIRKYEVESPIRITICCSYTNKVFGLEKLRDLGTKKEELVPKRSGLRREKGTGKQHSKASLQSLNKLQRPGPPQIVCLTCDNSLSGCPSLLSSTFCLSSYLLSMYENPSFKESPSPAKCLSKKILTVKKRQWIIIGILSLPK